MRSNKKPYAFLYVFLSDSDSNLKSTFYLYEGENLIGSSISCSIKLNFPQVSARHCKIHLSNNGEYGLEDLGSEYGCYKVSEFGEKMKLKPNKEYDISENLPFYISKYKACFVVKEPKKVPSQNTGPVLSTFEEGNYQNSMQSNNQNMKATFSKGLFDEDSDNDKKKPANFKLNTNVMQFSNTSNFGKHGTTASFPEAILDKEDHEERTKQKNFKKKLDKVNPVVELPINHERENPPAEKSPNSISDLSNNKMDLVSSAMEREVEEELLEDNENSIFKSVVSKRVMETSPNRLMDTKLKLFKAILDKEHTEETKQTEVFPSKMNSKASLLRSAAKSTEPETKEPDTVAKMRQEYSSESRKNDKNVYKQKAFQLTTSLVAEEPESSPINSAVLEKEDEGDGQSSNSWPVKTVISKRPGKAANLVSKILGQGKDSLEKEDKNQSDDDDVDVWPGYPEISASIENTPGFAKNFKPRAVAEPRAFARDLSNSSQISYIESENQSQTPNVNNEKDDITSNLGTLEKPTLIIEENNDAENEMEEEDVGVERGDRMELEDQHMEIEKSIHPEQDPAEELQEEEPQEEPEHNDEEEIGHADEQIEEELQVEKSGMNAEEKPQDEEEEEAINDYNAQLEESQEDNIRMQVEESAKEKLLAEEATREKLLAEEAAKEKLLAEEALKEKLRAEEEALKEKLRAEEAAKEKLLAEEALKERLRAEEEEARRKLKEEEDQMEDAQRRLEEEKKRIAQEKRALKKKKEEELRKKRMEEEKELQRRIKEEHQRMLEAEEAEASRRRREEEQEPRLVIMIEDEDCPSARKDLVCNVKEEPIDDDLIIIEKKSDKNSKKNKTKTKKKKQNMEIEESSSLASGKTNSKDSLVLPTPTFDPRYVTPIKNSVRNNEAGEKKKRSKSSNSELQIKEEQRSSVKEEEKSLSIIETRSIKKHSESKETKKKSKKSTATNYIKIESESPSLRSRSSRKSSKTAERSRKEAFESEEKKSLKLKKVKGNAGEAKQPKKHSTKASPIPMSAQKSQSKSVSSDILLSSQKKRMLACLEPPTDSKLKTHLILFSGINKSLDIQEIKLKLGLLIGARVVDDNYRNFNVLVMDEFKRTVKLLVAINNGVDIVNFKWVMDSLRQGRLMSLCEYLYEDVESEKKYDYNLQDSLEIARNNQPGFLTGKLLWIARNVTPCYNDLRVIAESAGGYVVTSKPKEFKENLIIIMNEDDKRNYRELKALKYKIYKPELILSGSLKQRLDFAVHEIVH